MSKAEEREFIDGMKKLAAGVLALVGIGVAAKKVKDKKKKKKDKDD